MCCTWHKILVSTPPKHLAVGLGHAEQHDDGEGDLLGVREAVQHVASEHGRGHHGVGLDIDKPILRRNM